MKKLLLAALMFFGVAVFADEPTLVVFASGEGITVADEGDMSRFTPYKDKNFICGFFIIEGEQSYKAAFSAKKATFDLRPSMGVGTFEVKSFKVNGKEMLEKPVVISKKKPLPQKFEAEAADGMMKLELLVRNAE